LGHGKTVPSSSDEQDRLILQRLDMSNDRWERVKELLHQAMQLGSEQRESFLDKACSGDESLRAEVKSLLLAGEDVRSVFLQSAPSAADPTFESVRGLEAGQIFSERFQLVRKLGEGGMGQVWLCEQTSPVRRQVALKLIKAGMYDEVVVQRFQSERQSLAIMDHPAIAKIFDAGMTPQGQPYFVMEYVPGLPITEYCDLKRLGIRQRLELFIQACEGVQHAHQKAIIHRDLKPANILVVEVDGKPTSRIIDFGLAKVSTTAEGQSMFTRPGFFVGTPAYMSPEQADPHVQDVDTRTDVYSLGVVLYVLLAGSQPFQSGQKEPLDELLRRLREEEPPRPSTKVSQDRETSSAAAQARGLEPNHLVSLLRGELDWITMKALDKERARRYGSPSELADDVRRYLNHEPVWACPASAGYRLQKYVRRHRIAVGVTAGLFFLLAAFSILQAVQLHRTTRERDRANRERDRATRVTDFMTSMFKVSDPSEARGSSVTAREILDKASNEISTGLANDPEVQSQMMQVMASTYINLGLYGRAHELAKLAWDERLKSLGPNDPRTLESMAQLGWVLAREGQYEQADQLESGALEKERRIFGPEDSRTIETMDHLSVTVRYEGRNDESEKLAREAVGNATRKFGAESTQTIEAMSALAGALGYQTRYAEAEQVFRQLVNIEKRVLGPDDPKTLRNMHDLAATLHAQHRLKEAEEKYREVLADQLRVLGPEHPMTVLTMENLAVLLTDENRLAEGERLHREVLEIRSKVLGPEHPDTLLTQLNLADALLREGRVHESEKVQREALAIQVRVLGPENRDTLESQSNLAGILTREGRYAEAERTARSALDIQMRTLGPQHPDTVDSLRQLGTAMAHDHRYGEAAKLFHDAIDKTDSAGGQGTPWSVWYSFACVAAAADRSDDAVQDLREAVRRGYADSDSLMADEDLKNLHQNAHFREIVASMRKPATTAPSP
jgi:non-specific serine/threonine protein kinase/serine/threonine-protein kinase